MWRRIHHNDQVREATEEESRVPLQEWQALMVRKRSERQARETASKKSGERGGGSDGKGDGNGSGRSHGSGRRSKHSGRMSSRRKKYRRNEFQQMQQQEVGRGRAKAGGLLLGGGRGQILSFRVILILFTLLSREVWEPTPREPLAS